MRNLTEQTSGIITLVSSRSQTPANVTSITSTTPTEQSPGIFNISRII